MRPENLLDHKSVFLCGEAGQGEGSVDGEGAGGPQSGYGAAGA